MPWTVTTSSKHKDPLLITHAGDLTHLMRDNRVLMYEAKYTTSLDYIK